MSNFNDIGDIVEQSVTGMYKTNGCACQQPALLPPSRHRGEAVAELIALVDNIALLPIFRIVAAALPLNSILFRQ